MRPRSARIPTATTYSRSAGSWWVGRFKIGWFTPGKDGRPIILRSCSTCKGGSAKRTTSAFGRFGCVWRTAI
eukprot:1425270-Prymnesium_polylepis.1